MTTPNDRPRELFSPFLPTTFNIPEEDDRLKTYLNENLANFADVVNDKKIGAYTEDSIAQNGNKFSYDTTKKIRNGFQVIARVKSFINQVIPLPIQDVNPQFIVSLVYGSASLPCTAVGAADGDYFSFMSAGDPRISFTMNDLNITIVTDGARASYSGFIVIEFIRDGV